MSVCYHDKVKVWLIDTQIRRRVDMPEFIDVRDLPAEQVQFLQQLIEFMRHKHQEATPQREPETINFRDWPLGATGPLSREEIYDDLDEQ